MQDDNIYSVESENLSYGSVLRELGNSTKDLIQSEIHLITSELKQSGETFAKHSAQAAAFGALLALSVLPFIAFLVIGLGEILGDRYWLSSLIVAVIFAAIGGPFALNAFRKIKSEDFKFTRTRASVDRGAQVMKAKVEEVKDAAKGERYEQNSLH
jgi:hypothetical protein